MKAVGITDHGTFAGAISMLNACRAEGIKPILGMEAYLARDHNCHSKDGQPDGRRGNRHLNLIAKNMKGFENICQLSHAASINGYYYDPRVDYELLDKYKEGIICTSACLSNVVNHLLSVDDYERAKKAVGIFKSIFGADYYMEMMNHGITAELRILPLIQKLAKEMDVKVIATNDCHYPEKTDAEFQEILMCMSSGKDIKDPNRLKFPYDEFYFKSPEEMYKLFNHIPSVMKNTMEIADKCDYSDFILGGNMRLPKFDIPEKFSSPYDYLKYLAFSGLKIRGLDNEPHVKRLTRELDDIKLIWDTKKYDFATYFLIVDEIMNFARENKIASGIRGSGYGSVLLQALGVTDGVDPLVQDLLWERFLGFDDKMFVCEADFGIGDEHILHAEVANSDADATEVMFR